MAHVVVFFSVDDDIDDFDTILHSINLTAIGMGQYNNIYIYIPPVVCKHLISNVNKYFEKQFGFSFFFFDMIVMLLIMVVALLIIRRTAEKYNKI